MADRPDKRSRKAALAAWKADQQAAARAALPLPDDRMQALFDMLEPSSAGVRKVQHGDD